MSRIAEAVAVAGVVRAAAETGLLAALADGPRREAELARSLDLSPRSLRLAVDALVALDVVTRDAGLLTLGAEATGHPLGLDGELAVWSHVPQWLRSGAPLPHLDGPSRSRTYHAVVGGLSAMWGDAPDRLAAALPASPRRVLDLGCGSGPWSLAIAGHHAEATVVGVDLPGVAVRFDEAARARGLAGRTRSFEADLDALPSELGADFDLVVLANVLRLDGPDVARRRIAVARRHLRPGGALLVVDALAAGTPAVELARALYAVHLACRLPNGALIDPIDLRAWLAEVGLERGVPIPLAPCPGALEALWAA